MSTNTFTSLNANFKTVYADEIQNLIPEGLVLVNMVKFMKGDKVLGNIYDQPVYMSLEHGKR